MSVYGIGRPSYQKLFRRFLLCYYEFIRYNVRVTLKYNFGSVGFFITHIEYEHNEVYYVMFALWRTDLHNAYILLL